MHVGEIIERVVGLARLAQTAIISAVECLCGDDVQGML